MNFMARKHNDPAANGDEGIAVLCENSATVAQTGAPANSPIIRLRRGPGGYAEWLVSISAICTDTPMRDRKLIRHKRFRNAIKYRFGVSLKPMRQAEWEAIVNIAKGAAS